MFGANAQPREAPMKSAAVTFRARNVDMIPLELVARRIATGASEYQDRECQDREWLNLARSGQVAGWAVGPPRRWHERRAPSWGSRAGTGPSTAV